MTGEESKKEFSLLDLELIGKLYKVLERVTGGKKGSERIFAEANSLRIGVMGSPYFVSMLWNAEFGCVELLVTSDNFRLRPFGSAVRFLKDLVESMIFGIEIAEVLIESGLELYRYDETLKHLRGLRDSIRRLEERISRLIE